VKKHSWLFMPVVFVFAMAGIAVAQDAAPAAAGGMPDWVKGILTGVLGGVMAGFLGWMKNRDTATGSMEKFEFKHLWPTLLVGALVGIAAHLMKMSPESLTNALESSPVYAGVVFAAEALWKAIWRNSVVTFRDALGNVKKGAGDPPTPPPAQ
jgi:hypothetical protein